MNTEIEKIEAYKLQLLNNKQKWEELLNTLINAFKEKNGVFRKVGLRDLGLHNDYEAYQIEQKTLQNKIGYEVRKMISKFSFILKEHEITVDLIDYRIPFQPIDNQNEKHYSYSEQTKLTTVSQVQKYLLDFDNDISLTERINFLLKESFFFNELDLVIHKGKSNYETIIKIAKSNFAYLNMFDKKGKPTIIGKIIKHYFDNFYSINKDETNDFGNSIYGIRIGQLDDFFLKFNHQNEHDKIELLKALDEERNLDKNIIACNTLFKSHFS